MEGVFLEMIFASYLISKGLRPAAYNMTCS